MYECISGMDPRLRGDDRRDGGDDRSEHKPQPKSGSKIIQEALQWELAVKLKMVINLSYLFMLFVNKIKDKQQSRLVFMRYTARRLRTTE
jgi:hypothetical protein